MKYLLTSILVSCVCLSALAQSAIGSWQTHMAYTNTTQITQSNEKVYGISGGTLYSILKTDHIIETYSKIYGLNDNGTGRALSPLDMKKRKLQEEIEDLRLEL